jgi:hypothetical protein
MPTPAPDFVEKPFDVRDIAPWAFTIVDYFGVVFRFLRTFRSIAFGQKLWEEPSGDLASRKLMSAWKFNLSQSLFSAAVAAGAMQLIILVFRPEGLSQSIFDSFWLAFLIPFSLGANAYVAGFAASSEDVDFSRVIRAYLYFDGMYGLFGQTIAATIFTIGYAYQTAKSWWPDFFILHFL